jgi:hypothetical protein
MGIGVFETSRMTGISQTFCSSWQLPTNQYVTSYYQNVFEYYSMIFFIFYLILAFEIIGTGS